MKSFENPARFEAELITNPDPFLMEYMGTYYCYSTDEDGVRVSVSEDLVNWSYRSFAFTDPQRRAFWAPCVVYRNGTFYMYVSDRPRESDDAHEQRLRVAISSDPLGPFEALHYLLLDEFAIDADVVFDQHGNPYMFYASNEFTGLDLNRPGTSIVLDKMKDLVTLAGNPRPVVVPTLPQEVFAFNRFGDERDWHTIEGGAYFTRRNRAFMTYSGNAYVRPDYFIGYSRADLEESIDSLEWSKVPDDQTFNPLMMRNAEVEGTGHNSVIQAPNLVDWWIIYHGRDAEEELLEDVEQRVMRLDELHFDSDEMWTDGPTSGTIAAPAPPNIESRSQVDLTPERSSELIIAEQVGPYVAEIYIRSHPGDSGARFAITALKASEADSISFWFDFGSRTVTARVMTSGIWTDLRSEELKDFDFTQWQPIRVERTLDQVILRRGEEVLIQVEHTWALRHADLAVSSQYTHTSVGYTRLSKHFDWYAEQGASIASVVTAPQPTPLHKNGVWCEDSTITFSTSPIDSDSKVTLDFWLPTPDSEVHVQQPGVLTQTLSGKKGRRQTLRLSAPRNTKLQLHLIRSALAGASCTALQ